MKSLLSYRGELISLIAASTAAWRDDAMAFVARALNAAEGRSLGAERARQARTEAIDAAIREAVGALPLTYDLGALTTTTRRRIGFNPERYGLKRRPSLRRVRRVLLVMMAESHKKLSGEL